MSVEDKLAAAIKAKMFPPADPWIGATVIELPIPPSTNALFFNPRGGHAGRIRTPEYNAWIAEAGRRLAQQRPASVPGKVALTIELQEPATKVRQDCTNRVKAIEDLLVRHGVIQGDDQRYVREVVVRWVEGIKGARVVVRHHT
jgi:Holliday junction resolvase RusA-like endonuclease